jgi:GAF domain
MRWINLFLLFFISLALGYAPEIFTYYVALVSPNDISVISGEVEASACSKETSSSKCTNIYRINEIDKLKNKYPDLAIGSGMIIYATRYYCDDGTLVSQFDDYINPGRSFEIFNIYQTVSVDRECKSLEIESWGPKEAVRNGEIAGLFVAGNRDAVSRVKQVNEFFRSGIYQVFSFCFLFLAAISIFLRRSLPDLAPDEFDYSLPWWIISAFSNAGIIQIFLPIANIPQWQNKFGAVVFLACLLIHYGHGLKILRRANYKIYLILFLVSSALILNIYFAVFYVSSLFVIGLTGLIPAMLIGNRSLSVISILVILAALKIQFNWPLPNPMIIYFFVGVVALEKLIVRLKITSRLSQFLSFISKMQLHQIYSKTTMSNLVAKAKASTEIPFVTVLHVHSDGKLEICRFHEADSAFFIDSIPPVFAHAISLRNEIWHLRVADDTYLRIVRNSSFSRIQVGNYFSIIPLYDEARLYGAISVTGYSDEYTRTGEKETEQRAVVRILADQVKNLLRSAENNAKNEWTGIASEFLNTSKHIDSEEALQKTAEGLATLANASVFIAELNKDTEKFKIVGISGFDPYVQERLIKGSIYAKDENLQGPIALAANKRKAIIVQDVALLKEVLHENSVQFFLKNDTKSCAGIPIFLDDENSLWGVLWLERRSSMPPITLLAETPLSNIASFIGKSISSLEIRKSLKSFVPEHKYEDFVKNEKVDDIEFGYLLGIDFKGSTKVSLEKGAAFWESAMKKLYSTIDGISAANGIKLHEFNWDFFVFSIPSEKPDNSKLEMILSFVKDIAPEIERWYQSEMGSISESIREKKQKFRVCVSFGDTTRGLKGAEVKTWGFKGAAIASLVKLEDTCKRLDGILFYDEFAVHSLKITSIVPVDARVVGTGAQIYKNVLEWPDLVRPKKQLSAKKKVI